MNYSKQVKKSRIWFILFIVAVLMLWLVLAGCDSAPKIVRPSGPENPIVEKMRQEARLGTPTPPNNSWLWWYAPVAGISVMWAVKYLFFRKCVEEEIGTVTLPEEPTASNNTGPNDETKPTANS